MTKLVTAGAILVLAIVFGFIFWNQFTSNQQQLAGTNANQTASHNTTSQTAAVPKNDNLDSIDAALSGSNIDSIDSDSTQMNYQLKSY